MPVVESRHFQLGRFGFERSRDEERKGTVEIATKERPKNETIALTTHSMGREMSKSPPIKGPPILLRFRESVNAEFALK